MWLTCLNDLTRIATSIWITSAKCSQHDCRDIDESSSELINEVFSHLCGVFVRTAAVSHTSHLQTCNASIASQTYRRDIVTRLPWEYGNFHSKNGRWGPSIEIRIPIQRRTWTKSFFHTSHWFHRPTSNDRCAYQHDGWYMLLDIIDRAVGSST